MEEQNPQEPELIRKIRKKRISIPKIRIPGGGKFKYFLIAAAVLVFAYNLLFVY